MKKRETQKERAKTRLLIIAAVILLASIVVLIISQAHYEKTHGSTTVIMLDAGHGGDASGIQGIVSEDAVDEEIVNRLEEKLSADSRFKVARTHEAGTAMNTADRVKAINDTHPDLVVSVHCAQNPDSSVSGTRVFADIPSSKYHDDSTAAATMIAGLLQNAGRNVTTGYFYYHPLKEGIYQEHIADFSDTTDYQEDTFDLMAQAEAPVVRIEHLYVTNQSDADEWANEEAYDKAAGIYYDALVNRFCTE
ncbi:MAG: N-acetylmuramoyl-L-alanine amidase [Bulleidia sp.]|nr:N-acetylmuramoyl-L-alanine amidase [Bulleidia sp.]